MLELRSVTKRFGGVVATDNVALEVPYFSVLFWLTAGLMSLLLFQARSEESGERP